VSQWFYGIDLCKIFRMQNIEGNNHAYNTISLLCMTGNVYLHVSNPAKAIIFLRAKKSSAHLPSEEK